MNDSFNPQAAGSDSAGIVRRSRRVFIRDLVLAASIGVYRHERERAQRVRINVDLDVAETGEDLGDAVENVVSYEHVAEDIRRLIAAGHVNLAETLAERIAAMCLKDRRVRVARVRVEKLDVLTDAVSAGVEVECHSVGA